MKSIKSAAAMLVGLWIATPAVASDTSSAIEAGASPAGTVHRLPPEEVRRILADAAEKPRMIPDKAGEPSKKIRGEMGVMIGTGGARAAYGSAVVPLGDRGVAAFSFETGRYPGYDRRIDRGRHQPF